MRRKDSGVVRVRLDLAYDGADFAGWQRQPDRDTVQQRMELALGRLYRTPPGEEPALLAAGRTDAGVHAEGQVAHYDAPRRIPPHGIRAALNGLLPPSIRVMAAREAAPDFHARYDAVSKTYRYHLIPGPIASPLASRFAWATGRPLDRAALETAAAAFRGTHDFRAFFHAPPDERPKDPVRTVTAVRVFESGPALVVEVSASGFLRYMVRRMVGTLEAIGRGQAPAGRIAEMLEAPDHPCPRFRAPPAGLRLHRVLYPDASAPGSAASARGAPGELPQSVE